MKELGESRPTFCFDVHGEVNTDKPELGRERAHELGIGKVMVASETGLSALKVLDAFEGSEVICKPRYAWPINQRDWKGNLKQYRRFTKEH